MGRKDKWKDIVCPICREKITANMAWCLRIVRGEIHKVHQACDEESDSGPEYPAVKRE